MDNNYSELLRIICSNEVYFLSFDNSMSDIALCDTVVNVQYRGSQYKRLSGPNSIGGTTSLDAWFYVRIPARYSLATGVVITPLSAPTVTDVLVDYGYDLTITSFGYSSFVTNNGYSCRYVIYLDLQSEDIEEYNLYATATFDDVVMSFNFSPANC